MKIANSPEATADQLANVVKLDQSLSTKVLRLANSAYFGRKSKAENITDAVVTLGFGSVRNLAASASVIDALFPRKMFPGFSWQDMWIHSVICAVAAESLYSLYHGAKRSNESAFVAGLLHDIGKLIIARALPAKFIQVVEACREYEWEMVRSETSYLGTNHALIGGDLARQWEFPEVLVAGITHHHNPEGAGEHEDLARAVSAGNLLAKRLGRNYILGVRLDVSLKDVAEVADTHPDNMEYVVNNVRDGLRQCGEIMAWGNALPGADRKAA